MVASLLSFPLFAMMGVFLFEVLCVFSVAGRSAGRLSWTFYVRGVLFCMTSFIIRTFFFFRISLSHERRWWFDNLRRGLGQDLSLFSVVSILFCLIRSIISTFFFARFTLSHTHLWWFNNLTLGLFQICLYSPSWVFYFVWLGSLSCAMFNF